MAKKKRRTELDIDPSPIAAPQAEEPEPEPEPEEAPPPPPEPEEKPKSERFKKINKVKLAIMGSIAFGAITIIGGVSWGVYTFLNAEEVEEPKKVEEKTEKQKPKRALLPQAQAVITPTYQFHPFLMRSTENKKPVLIRVSFAAEMSDNKVKDEITRNLVLIRENIYYFLEKMNANNFVDMEKKRRMNIDIAIILNRSIQSGAVMKVFITDLVIK
jgi:flagellar basal body-associated protein FliL